MTPERLGDEIRAALDDAYRTGETDMPGPAHIDVTTAPSRGDYTTNAPLQLSRPTGSPAMELARLVQRKLSGVEGIRTVDIAAGGFVNVTITHAAAGDLVREIVESGFAADPAADRLSPGARPALSRRIAADRLADVQYAHARTARIARVGERVGVRRRDGFTPAALTRRDIGIVARLCGLPRAARQTVSEPDRLLRYLCRLAQALHDWLDTCSALPFGDEEIGENHRTHRWLNDAGRSVLSNGLGMLAVPAPERM